jgi:hypothetical protein
MTIRVFCIFDQSNGFVKSSGRYDPDEIEDGSTMKERVQQILADNLIYRLVTRPIEEVTVFPRAGVHKIVGGEVVPLDPSEIPEPEPTPLERLASLEQRVTTLEGLIS